MKKSISIIFLILALNVAKSQTPNFTNMHNVVTSKKATCVKMSGAKLFFGTNDVTDKGLYMYDTNTGIKTMIDTSYGVRNMTRVTYIGNEYFVICTESYGFTIDNMGNKVGTSITNTGGFYDVVWNPIQQKLYWGCYGKIMYSNWNFSTPTSVPNPFFGNSNCIAAALECNNDTIYIGYSEPTLALSFIKYYNYNYINLSAINGNAFFTDGALLNNKYYFSRGQEIHNNAIPSTAAYYTNIYLFYSSIENISNTLWIASTNKVIFKFDGTFSTNQMNGTTYNVPTLDTIYDMEIDMSGQMWVASKNGLHTTANTTSTGIHENSKNIEFNVYPNPSQNEITISNVSDANYKITNAVGQIILQGIINENFKTIDISKIYSGLYFIKIYDERTNLLGTKKIIKN